MVRYVIAILNAGCEVFMARQNPVDGCLKSWAIFWALPICLVLGIANGMLVFIPFLIILFLIFATWAVFRSDKEELEKRKHMSKEELAKVKWGDRNAILGLVITWVFGLVVAVWMFNNF